MPSFKTDGIRPFDDRKGFEVDVPAPEYPSANSANYIKDNQELLNYAASRRGEPKSTEIQHVLGVSDDDLDLWDFAVKNPEDPRAPAAKGVVFEGMAKNASTLPDRSKQHEGVSLWDRFKVKWESDPALQDKYLRSKGLETRRVGGTIEVRRPGEMQFQAVDPEGFDWFDVVDIVPEALEGAAFVMANPVTKTIPGAVVAGSALATGVEALRQTGGKMMGTREQYDPLRIGMVGLTGGAFSGAGQAFGPKMPAAPWRAKMRPDAPAVEGAFERIGGKATPESLTFDPQFRKQTQSLVESPTLPGAIARLGRGKNDRAFQETAEGLVEEALPQAVDKTSVGQKVKAELQEIAESRLGAAGKQFEVIKEKYADAPITSRNLSPILSRLRQIADEDKTTEVQRLVGNIQNELEQVKTVRQLDVWRSKLGKRLAATAPGTEKEVISRLYGPTDLAVNRALLRAGAKTVPDIASTPPLVKESKDISQVSALTWKRLFEESPAKVTRAADPHPQKPLSQISLGDYSLVLKPEGVVHVTNSRNAKELTPLEGIKLSQLPKFLGKLENADELGEELSLLRMSPSRTKGAQDPIIALGQRAQETRGILRGFKEVEAPWDDTREQLKKISEEALDYAEEILDDPLDGPDGPTELGEFRRAFLGYLEDQSGSHKAAARKFSDTVPVQVPTKTTETTALGVLQKSGIRYGKAPDVQGPITLKEAVEILKEKGLQVPNKKVMDPSILEASKSAKKEYSQIFDDFQKSFNLLPPGKKFKGAGHLKQKIEDLPVDSTRDRLFNLKNPTQLESMSKKFPEQYTFMRRSLLSKIARNAQSNNRVTPEGIVNQFKGLGDRERVLLFGEKAQDAKALEIALGAAIRETQGKLPLTGFFRTFTDPRQLQDWVKLVTLHLRKPKKAGTPHGPGGAALGAASGVESTDKNTFERRLDSLKEK